MVEVALFGGSGSGGPLDDLWTWNGQRWLLRCQGCTGVPRTAANVIYDPLRNSVLIIGGYTGASEIAGTWEWTGGTATQVLSSTLPPARDSAAAAYDEARDIIVYYGGNGDSCIDPPGGDCDDHYEYTPVD